MTKRFLATAILAVVSLLSPFAHCWGKDEHTLHSHDAASRVSDTMVPAPIDAVRHSFYPGPDRNYGYGDPESTLHDSHGVYRPNNSETLEATDRFLRDGLDNIRVADKFAGADAGHKIAAAIADLPSTGGIVDARELEGAQTISSDVFASSPKPITLLLGSGTYTLSATQNLASNHHIIGLGAGSTLLSYTGSGTAIRLTSGTQYGSIESLGVYLGKSSTAVGLQLDASKRVVSRNQFRALRFDTTGGGAVVAGQVGIRLTGGPNGSDLVSFNHFAELNFLRIDRPIITDGPANRVNQNKFVNLSFEQFGDSANPDRGAGAGNGIAIYNGAKGGNNTWSNLSFSKGGSTAINEIAIYDMGSANSYLGASHDGGTGAAVWFPSGAANNVFIGTGSTIPTDVDNTNIIIFGGWGFSKHLTVRNQGMTAIEPNVLSAASVVASLSEQAGSSGRLYARGSSDAAVVLNHTGANSGQRFGELLYANGILKFSRYDNDFSSLTSTPINLDTNDLLALTGALKMQFGTRHGITFDGSPTGPRTLRLPDSTDTLVGKATRDSLTNKGYARRIVGLLNGANNDIDIGANNFIRISGPSAAFSVSGFAGGFDGRVLYLYNAIGQEMTITNEGSESASENRITTLRGRDVTLRRGLSFATFIYDSAASRWILTATN